MKNSVIHGVGRRHISPEALNLHLKNNDPGLFGRMFPKLKPLKVADADLAKLADAMRDSASPQNDTETDNKNLPAGYTYFGQFVDHDITLDTTPIDKQMVDPLGVENFLSPKLDLDSLYGQGPGVSSHLYAREQIDEEFVTTAKFLLGKTQPTNEPGTDAIFPNDLPRNAHGRALIGDERNDENLLVAQTHLLFLKFHNKVVDLLLDNGFSPSGVFEEARRIVTWHYQWIVLYDFIERITEDGLVDQIRHHGRKFYRFKKFPYIPAEFSAAAYRWGHSAVRNTYNHNKVFNETSFDLLFAFTGKSGNIVGELANGGFTFETLPSNWIIDWNRFFQIEADPSNFNFSRKIDALLAPELHNLPGGDPDNPVSLAFLNLKRGVNLGLPSGQDVAKALKVKVLTEDEITAGSDGEVLKKLGLHEKTPLWFYLLKEADIKGRGERMGPAGCLLLAEVFLGLVHGDHDSFLWQRSDWQPELPSAEPGKFTMVDLVNFVQDINPIGS